jgi:serine/threonine-protein kinase SRPK3
VFSFRRNAPNKALKPYIVKNIISQVLEALVQLHSLDIIHTGADN